MSIYMLYVTLCFILLYCKWIVYCPAGISNYVEKAPHLCKFTSLFSDLQISAVVN